MEAGAWPAEVAACSPPAQVEQVAGAVQPWEEGGGTPWGVATQQLLEEGAGRPWGAAAGRLWVGAAGLTAGAGAAAAAARWRGWRWRPQGRTLAARSCW